MAAKMNLLFVMPDLGGGGAERSLITILSLIDYNRYEVDLKLFHHSGIFLSQLPETVNLLEEEPLLGAFSKGYPEGKKRLAKIGYKHLAILLLLRAICKRMGIFRIERCIWAFLSRRIVPSNKCYDVCIAFLEEYATYYMADFVNATRKIAFLHINYIQARLNPRFDVGFYQRCDRIVVVSQESMDVFRAQFPQFANKVCFFENILPVQWIQQQGSFLPDNLNSIWFTGDMPVILTVGRIERQKGYDIGLEAIKLLNQQGVSCQWFILGTGSQQKKLKRKTIHYGLQNRVIFLGIDSNPYRYMKACTLYFQPSRWEGKPIATREAACFAKPMVVSDIPPFQEIFREYPGALLVPLSPEDFAKTIRMVLEQPTVSAELVRNNELLCKKEQKGGITPFYRLLIFDSEEEESTGKQIGSEK
ncbi:glycosyltransferase [uncultured Alistipes sp.]|uniref:glycosyltransferase n=1 Tax=uncultured Alistipes sp. TaxID=538949 RepID=UPI00259B012A|nr:glycosyltransferase [uncultured Alistipes sp.]